MSKKEKRFIKIHAEGSLDGSEIWVDKETGVNYFFHFSFMQEVQPQQSLGYFI